MLPDSPAAAPGTPPATQSAPATTLPQTGTTPGTPGGYYQADGPEANPPPNLEATPDPVPQVEPLNKFANEPYVALGQTFVPDKSGKQYAASGIASWYGKQFHGRKTASGEIYNMYAMSAAHPTLPIPSYARVTNRKNNKSVIVRVNDRGPFHANRVIDLSYTAALKLGYIQQGSAEVTVESITGKDFATNTVAPQAVAPQAVAAVAGSAAQTAVAVAPAASSGNKPGYLQLGVFSNPTNAQSFREKIMQDLTWLTEPIEIFIVDKLYRVRIGPFSDNNLASNISSRVKSSLGIAPVWAPM
ncbi:MAG: septal ring lytic transglycosylase RlpA family protein [Burkholderiales bacterium]